MLTDEQIAALKESVKQFRIFWRRADGAFIELLSVGTHPEEPNPVAYVAQPPGGYIALDNVTLEELQPTGVRKHRPVFLGVTDALDADTRAKIDRGEWTLVPARGVVKVPPPSVGERRLPGLAPGDPESWIRESARAIHERAEGVLNWIVVSDAAYVELEDAAGRAAMSVDAFVEHMLRQKCISLPHTGKPFKVFRASELGGEGFKFGGAARRQD